MLVLGAALLVGGVYLLISGREMASWPTTPGYVVSRYLENVSPAGKPFRERYRPHLEYEYMVDGKRYKGDRIQPADVVTTKAEAQRMLDRFSDDVTVHYNPENPAEAFLEPLSAVWAWLMLAAGVILLFIGLVKLIVMFD